MVALETPWWEIIIRVVLVYIALLGLVRASGKRQLGELTPMDLLTMIILAETMSKALTGFDHSLAAGLIAATTLVALTFGIGWLAHRSVSFERLIEGKPSVLIRDGIWTSA